MIDLIGELEATHRKLNEIKEKIEDEHNVIGVRMGCEYESCSVYLQYRDDVFFDKFDNFIVSNRKESDIPFEVSSEVGNIMHFTILDQREYEDYVEAGVIK